MKREHFNFVSEYFDLTQYNGWNNTWQDDYEFERADTIYVAKRHRVGPYTIRAHYNHVHIFVHIPSEELANKIIEFIRDTEMLFV